MASNQFNHRLPEDLEHLIDPAAAQAPAELTVACYTFPHFHRSAFNDRLYSSAWSEYVLMRGCRPWFPGHHQPRTPMLGELDEREPTTWETYIDLAVASGIDAFIFDWYWYGGEPVLHEALEDGFLRSRGRERMRFAVMWTNHPWAYWFPTVGMRVPDPYLEPIEPTGLGGYERTHETPESEADIWRGLAYIVSRYFHDPNYWRIDGKPVLAIWDVSLIVQRFGLEGTRALLDELREFARKLGHSGIHIHASQGGWPDDLAATGIDSYGLYNSIVAAIGRRPDSEATPEYGSVAANVVAQLWPEGDARCNLPYFPCVSPGWDDAPRHLSPSRPEVPSRRVWPATGIVVDETPAAFEAFVKAGLAFLNQRPHIPPVLLVGTWNEWTEGHYLLPDTRLGFGMARALARGLGRDRPIQ